MTDPYTRASQLSFVALILAACPHRIHIHDDCSGNLVETPDCSPGTETAPSPALIQALSTDHGINLGLDANLDIDLGQTTRLLT